MGKLLMVPMIWPQFHLNVTNSQHCHIWGEKGNFLELCLTPAFSESPPCPPCSQAFSVLQLKKASSLHSCVTWINPRLVSLQIINWLATDMGEGAFKFHRIYVLSKSSQICFPKQPHTCIVVWFGVAGHGGMLKVSDGKIGAQPETSPPAPNNGEHCVRFTFRLQCFYHTHLFQRALRKRECGYEV